ncbi:MAG: DoxX family membrane protein [Candidatus Binatia bacterium]
MNIVDMMLALRRLILAIAGALSWLGPTLARWTVGWIFVLSGWGKLHNLERVIGYFGELASRMPSCRRHSSPGSSSSTARSC